MKLPPPASKLPKKNGNVLKSVSKQRLNAKPSVLRSKVRTAKRTLTTVASVRIAAVPKPRRRPQGRKEYRSVLLGKSN